MFAIRSTCNSCYLDVCLVALFHFLPPDHVADHPIISLIQEGYKTQIQKQPVSFDILHLLLIICDIISKQASPNLAISREETTAINDARDKLRHCFREHTGDTRWLLDQLEPFEVVMVLNDVFNIQPDISTHIEVYGSADIPSEPALTKIQSFEGKQLYSDIMINVDDLISSSGKGNGGAYDISLHKWPLCISDTGTQNEGFNWCPDEVPGTCFSRRVEAKTFKSASCVVIHICRAINEHDKSTHPIHFPAELPLLIPKHHSSWNGEQTKLRLYSVIVHIGPYSYGGHYIVCTYKPDQDAWYVFDPVGACTKLPGSGIEALRAHSNSFVMHNCTDLVYA